MRLVKIQEKVIVSCQVKSFTLDIVARAITAKTVAIAEGTEFFKI